MTGLVVSVFITDRRFGGPEEGGWWYDVGRPSDEFAEFTRGFAPTEVEAAQAYALSLNEGPMRAENWGRKPIGSVLSTGIYEAQITEGMPKPYPETRQHYE